MAARRDIKALTAGIAGMTAGDRVRAGISHPRYGNFIIEATVVAGGDSVLTAGSWAISKNGKPSKHLTELIVLASAGKHDDAVVADAAGLAA